MLTWQNRIARTLVRERDLLGHWASRWRVIRTSNVLAAPADPNSPLERSLLQLGDAITGRLLMNGDGGPVPAS